MDQKSRQLAWWAEAVFRDWRQRPGPRYAKLAAAILEAIERKTLREGTRIPAERVLAAAIGVSRGTVVASFDHLVTAGVLIRRQGDGTYVTGRPSWTATTTSATTALLRRIAAGREVIDLAVASPGDLSHLPSTDLNEAWLSLAGHGLDPSGLPQLRQQVARHLTENQSLPTSPDQLVITSGAQEARRLLTRILAARTILASCPADPGLLSVAGGSVAGGNAVGSSRATITAVPGDAAGPDPGAIERAGRAPQVVALVMPTGHDPGGAVMPAVRRQSIAAIADAGRVTVIEDLSLADLTLGAGHVPAPLAALSPRVIAVGSASKLLWGGLRVGWIRVADESLRAALIGHKVALNLAASAISQVITAELLAAITPGWLSAHRAALTRRRDHLLALLAAHLPAWQVHPPEAGLSVWAELPLSSADGFVHAAARHGVTLTPGAMACVDGKHLGFVRLSFALEPGTLELAAERLAAAWAAHAEDLAVAPMGRGAVGLGPNVDVRSAGVAGHAGAGRSGLPRADRIAQYPDAGRLQLHHVAGLDPAVQLKAAPAADGADREELAGVDRLVERRPGQHFGEGELPVPGGPGRPGLAVDPGRQLDGPLVYFVHGEDARAHRAAEILALGRPDGEGHLEHLDIPRTDIVENRDARDQVRCLFRGEIDPAASDEEAEFELEVELRGV